MIFGRYRGIYCLSTTKPDCPLSSSNPILLIPLFHISSCTTQMHSSFSLGWLTGLARVGEVQPGPVPAKPVPVRVRVQTRTVYPWVSSNTAGTRKPVELFRDFLIFSHTYHVFFF